MKKLWPALAICLAANSVCAQSFPNDPGYPGQWNFFSRLPPAHDAPISDFERAIGSGVRADLSWQLHTGHPDTVVAVLDCGIRWDNRDLAERVRLNTGELPLPEGATKYDANGDGRVSASDYANDTRVGDRNGNGFIDAEDLILAFSDGSDADGNGFIDDIAGWDFHEGDNNPGDRTHFGHGTGEATLSVAAINNGIGDAGVCGNCSFVPLRLNDSFVVDTNSFSRAVVYATDMGAAVIQQALGGLNHNPTTQAALDYAYNRGVIVIGSAADENSFHHNYPSTIDPAIYPNNIRFDSREAKAATTFLNFNNCSNFGARVDVSVPGVSCSSEATGMLSGITALAQSYATSLGRRLSPGTMTALIRGRAIDINRGSNAAEPSRHSSYPGWDVISGYGRADSWGMMQAIKGDKLPPEARIISPKWFAFYRGPAGLTVPVTVLAKGRGPMVAKLEVARGVETHASVWRVIAEKSLASELSGEMATLTGITLADLVPSVDDGAHYRDAYTLRLTVTAADGLVAESRRTVFVADDPTLLAGFPKPLAGSGESSGLFIDLDGQGREAFVAADGAGFVHAFTVDGTEHRGFPVHLGKSRYDMSAHGGAMPELYESVIAPIAAGDLTGDGRPELVTASFEGGIYAWDADGVLLAGFPVMLPPPDWTTVSKEQTLGRGVIASPVLADLDGDGKRDIIIAGLDGQVYAFNHEGHALSGFPVAAAINGRRAKIVSSPAVADIDGDGTLDLVFGTNHIGDDAGYLFAVSGHGTKARDGSVLSGFPVRIPLIRDHALPTVGEGITAAPVICDCDGDGRREIFIHGFAGKAYFVSFTGQLRSLSMQVGSGHNTNDTMMIPGFGAPAVGDVSGDGVLDPVTTGVGKRILVSIALGGKKFDFDHMIGAWNGGTGQMLNRFPRRHDDMMIMSAPVLADLDGDGKEDIVAGSGGYFVRGFTASGEAPGFPKFTGGWLLAAPALGDMDGDGRLELAATTRDGYLFIWRTDARRPLDGGWLMAKGNPQRTGVR